MGLPLLIFINLILAGTPLFMKVAGAQGDAVHLVWLRHTIAFLVMMPVMLRAPWHRLRAAEWGRIIAVASVAFVGASLLQMVAVERSGASAGALMVALEPIAMIVLAVCCLREVIHTRHVIALALALSGFVVISHGAGHAMRTGNFLYIIAVFCEATFPILLRPLLARHSPAQVLCCCLGCASVFLLPLQWSEWPLVRQQWHAQWPAILYLGVGCSAFASYLWLVVLQRLSVSTVAVTWFLQPVCGSIMAVLFLHETMTVSMGCGGVLILSAVGLLGERSHAIAKGHRRQRRLAFVRAVHAVALSPDRLMTLPQRPHWNVSNDAMRWAENNRARKIVGAPMWRSIPLHLSHGVRTS